MNPFPTGICPSVRLSPYPRRLFGATSARLPAANKFVVCGGRTFLAWDVRRECNYYDAKRNEWRAVPHLNKGRWGGK